MTHIGLHIDLILEDPGAYWSSGKVNALVTEARRNADELRRLLGHPNVVVQRLLSYTLSELGQDACGFVEEVDQLMDLDDRFVTYNALEVLLLCAKGERADCAWPLFVGLEREDVVLKKLCIRLLRNADDSQWQAASRIANQQEEFIHARCIERVVQSSDPVTDSRLMLMSGDAVSKAYGLVLALTHSSATSDVILDAASSCSDADIQETASYMARLLKLDS